MGFRRPFYHHDHDGCGCGEEHHHDHDTCGCGEEHHHDHDTCGCGEEHHHDHSHGPDCDCPRCHPHAEYCDVCGESLANCVCAMPDDGVEKAVYILENLGCANCAAKMERKIKELPGVRYASVTFATKQLRLAADGQAALLPKIRDICTAIESDVRVVPRERPLGAVKTVSWIVSGLSAENASAAEAAIRALPGVTNAVLEPKTARLTVTSPSPHRLKPRLEAVCRGFGKEITLTEAADETPAAASASFFNGEGKKKLVILAVGAALFLGGVLTRQSGAVSLILFIAAYLLLAKDVLLTAGRNMLKGRVFDEHFLMSVASLGAFAIGEYSEAVAVVLFFFVGELFEDQAVAKSRGQIMEAVDLRPETVLLLVGEETTEIPAADAVVGDIVVVRPGDRVPLDGVVIDGESRLDTSPLTGEPLPVAVAFGDEALSGCVNIGGTLKLRVEKPLTESMVTRILHSVEQAAAGKPKIDRFITRFARYYTPCVVVLAALTALVPPLLGGSWYYWIHTALTFLVISCPCALVLSVPLAYFSGIGVGSRHGILFKGGVSLEALRKVRAVVMDKTGTVTKGTFAVTAVETTAGRDENEVLAFAAAAERMSTHPIGHSVLAAAGERGLALPSPEEVREIAGRGVAAKVKGRKVICGSAALMAAENIPFPDFAETSATEVRVAVDGAAAGRILIADEIKADAADAVKALAKRGLTTVMLTGDREETAAAAAKEAGIDAFRAGLMPQDKLTELTDIRRRHGAVMFVGDGINDAPVLAAADVGAAMGSGADAAIEAADVVFMNSEMSAVPLSLRIAAKVGRVAVENVVFALAMKFLVMILGLAGYANMWFAIFADTGVAILCVLNAVRVLIGRIR